MNELNPSGTLPQPNPNLVSRRFEDEYLVLDPHDNQAHALDGEVAIVWRCLEERTIPPLPDDRVDAIIAQLREKGLLQAAAFDEPERVELLAGISRRTLLKTGAATVALAGLTTIALPSAAAASSIQVGPRPTPIPDGDTFIVPPHNIPIYVTVIGGGGGGGGTGHGYRRDDHGRRGRDDFWDSDHQGGPGADGAVWHGTITNSGATAVQLTVAIGGGGRAGADGTDGGAGSGGQGGIAGSNGSAAGGPGGRAGGADGGGGGGGGASSAILHGTTALIIAGGGGGGGGGGTGNDQDGEPGQPYDAFRLVHSVDGGAGQNGAFTFGGGGGGGAGGGSGSNLVDGGAGGGDTGGGGYSQRAWSFSSGTLSVTPGGFGAGGWTGNGGGAGNGGWPGDSGAPGAVFVSTRPGGE